MVEVSVTVGKLDASLALLLTKDHHLIEFPTLLLPNDVEAGSIVKITCERDIEVEKKDKQVFSDVQSQILSTFGLNEPRAPVLRVRNTTQTSVVLEWDPIDVATATVLSLTLFKNNQRFGLITSPLKRTSTKISGLAIDNAYTFHLVLATTAGVYTSEKVTLKTHKMTDLSGITICVGSLDGSEIDEAELAETATKIGAKPLQHSVKVDTTHFVCTIGEGPEWKRAQDLNIPVVTPEWVKACENERRLVGVKRYYLDADPKDRPPVQRQRAVSATTMGSVDIKSDIGTTAVGEATLTVDSEDKKLELEQVPEKEEEHEKKEAEQNGSGEFTEVSLESVPEKKLSPVVAPGNVEKLPVDDDTLREETPITSEDRNEPKLDDAQAEGPFEAASQAETPKVDETPQEPTIIVSEPVEETNGHVPVEAVEVPEPENTREEVQEEDVQEKDIPEPRDVVEGNTEPLEANEPEETKAEEPPIENTLVDAVTSNAQSEDEEEGGLETVNLDDNDATTTPDKESGISNPTESSAGKKKKKKAKGKKK